MSYTFDQTKGWGYVNGTSISSSGCGCCASASIIYNVKANITPVITAKWLAARGWFGSSGTYRIGITNLMKSYSYNVNYYTPEGGYNTAWKNAASKMAEYFKAGTDFWMIFLVVPSSKGSKGTNFWTSVGHYVSATSYKVENNVVYVYIRDSGSRKHSGWYKLTDLLYYTNVIYIFTRPSKSKYTGDWPTCTVKAGCTSKQDVVKVQLFLNWYFGKEKVAVDGVIKANGQTEKAIMEFQESEGLTKDGSFGSKSLAKAQSIVR